MRITTQSVPQAVADLPVLRTTRRLAMMLHWLCSENAQAKKAEICAMLPQ